MNVQISMWGNSLGLRLPRALANQIGISEGQKVKVTAEGSRLIVEAVAPRYGLDDLLANMTPEAAHAAFDGATTSAAKSLMTKSPYVPDAGDLIWTDVDPRIGREQSGRRSALVLSPAALFSASGFTIVCPITRTVRNFGSGVLLPSGLPVLGEILTYQVRGIDTLARPIRYAGSAVPIATLVEVRAKLATLCGISS